MGWTATRGLAGAAVASALLATWIGGTAGAAVRPSLPDLATQSAGAPRAAVAGSRVKAVVLLRNRGATTSRTARIGFYLSHKRRLTGATLLGTTLTKPLRAGRHRRVTRHVLVPRAMPAGSYRLLVCADPTGRIRESSERDNCTLASRAIRISTAGTPAPTIAPQPSPEPAPSAGPAAAPTSPATPPPPSVVLSAPADGSFVTAAEPAFSGTATAASMVTTRIYSGTTAQGSAAAQAQALPDGSGDWSATAGSSLTDGTYTALAEQTDWLGRTGDSAPHSFTVDTTAPVVQVTLNPSSSSGSYSSPPTVHVTADDANFQSLACTLDGAAAALTNQPASSSHDAEGDIAVSGSGSHTVACTATDRAALTGSDSKSFTVDGSAPVVSMTSPSASLIGTATPGYAGTAGTALDDGATVTVKVYAGTTPSGTPVQTRSTTRNPSSGAWSVSGSPALADGTYTAQAEQSDLAGNVGRSPARTFDVDTQAPTVSVTLNPTAAGNLYQTKPTVHVDAADAHLKSLTCNSDGTTTTISGSSGDVPVNGADGSHTVSCTATDQLDRTATDSKTFTVDSTPPGVTVAHPTAGQVTADSTPTYDGSAGNASTDSQTVTVKVYSGTNLAQPALSTTRSGTSWSVTGSTALPDGPYSVQAEQSDTAGNLGQSASRSFTVDTTSPSVTLTLSPSAPDGLNGWYVSMPTVHVSASDANPASLTCNVDGTVTAISGSSGDVPVAGDGSHSVSCTANDAAGNSTTRSTGFKVDTTAPTVGIAHPADGAETPLMAFDGSAGTAATDAQSVTVKVLSGGSAIRSQAASAPSGSWSQTVSPVLPAGTYTARAEQVDEAGNVGRADHAFTVPNTLLAAGDIASCSSSGDEATAALLGERSGTVGTLGDNVYSDGIDPEGSLANFDACYDPSWGALKSRTSPSIGNHEYNADSTASGYFDYFGSAAGTRGQGYYSYDLGAWHVIVLNTNLSCSATIVSCAAGSPQETWLRSDLAAHPTQCTLAYFHHPRFSSYLGSNSTVRPLWDALYQYGADVILNGHAHTYERFAARRPDGTVDASYGLREFIVGTGGASHHTFTGTLDSASEAFNDDTFGILQLTLGNGSYGYRFVPAPGGGGFTDSGSGSCHGAP